MYKKEGKRETERENSEGNLGILVDFGLVLDILCPIRESEREREREST